MRKAAPMHIEPTNWNESGEGATPRMHLRLGIPLSGGAPPVPVHSAVRYYLQLRVSMLARQHTPELPNHRLEKGALAPRQQPSLSMIRVPPALNHPQATV